MVILRSRKILYIRTHKAASTSIESILRSLMAPGDYASWDRFEGWETIGEGGFRPHAHAGEVRARFTDWDKYYSFTADRNPWKKAVSEFMWRKTATLPNGEIPHNVRIPDEVSFHDYVLGEYKYLSNSNFYMEADGRLIVNCAISVENLEQGLSEVLGSEPGAKIERLKESGLRSYDYRDFYDKQTIDAIAMKDKRTIDRFGYEFDFESPDIPIVYR